MKNVLIFEKKGGCSPKFGLIRNRLSRTVQRKIVTLQPTFTWVLEYRILLSKFYNTLVSTDQYRSTVVLRNATSNILCTDPANDPNHPPGSCIQSIIEFSLFLAVFGLRSGVFDTIRDLLADEAEF